jgi:hypothetical protein
VYQRRYFDTLSNVHETGRIRSRNSKRVKKYNGQKKKDKKTYNDLQNTIHITKDAAIRTPLKTGDFDLSVPEIYVTINSIATHKLCYKNEKAT